MAPGFTAHGVGLRVGLRPCLADEETPDERSVVEFVACVSSLVHGSGFQTQGYCSSVEGRFLSPSLSFLT